MIPKAFAALYSSCVVQSLIGLRYANEVWHFIQLGCKLFNKSHCFYCDGVVVFVLVGSGILRKKPTITIRKIAARLLLASFQLDKGSNTCKSMYYH